MAQFTWGTLCARRRLTPACLDILGLSGHGHKSDRGNLFAANRSVLLLLNHEQILKVTADRDHESPTHSELIQERLRNMVRSRCHDNYVEGSVLGPSPVLAR